GVIRYLLRLRFVIQVRSDRVAGRSSGAVAARSFRATIRRQSFPFDDAARSLAIFLFDNFLYFHWFSFKGLFANPHNRLWFYGLVARTAFGVQEPKKLLQHLRVGRIPEIGPFPPHLD